MPGLPGDLHLLSDQEVDEQVQAADRAQQRAGRLLEQAYERRDLHRVRLTAACHEVAAFGDALPELAQQRLTNLQQDLLLHDAWVQSFQQALYVASGLAVVMRAEQRQRQQAAKQNRDSSRTEREEGLPGPTT